MLKEIGFSPSAGRESLWTTGEIVGFSKAHCEVQKQPNLDLSFRGQNPIPLLKSNLHMKSLGLDPWPAGSSKSPIFSNFEVNVTKYIRNLNSANYGRTLFGPLTSLHPENCRGVWPVVRLTAIWNCAFQHMKHPQLWSMSWNVKWLETLERRFSAKVADFWQYLGNICPDDNFFSRVQKFVSKIFSFF
jgi:hypothetical protein